MTTLSLFEELVASEAAVRADYIYRNKRITINDNGAPVIYDARNPDRGNSADEVAGQLYENFIRTYDYMFQDSSQHEKLVEARYCNTRDLREVDRRKLQKIFKEFVEDNYIIDGQVHLTAEDAVHALHDLYTKIVDEVPLSHAGMALGSLFVELGRGDKWKSVTPNGIDFTRGPSSGSLLHRIHDAIFEQNHTPETSAFISFPERVIDIGGVKFPYQMIKEFDRDRGYEMEKTHLITTSGNLVDLTNELRRSLEEIIAKGQPLDDFKVAVESDQKHLWRYQQPASEGSEKAKNSRRLVREKLDDMSVAPEIDGVPVKDADGGRLPESLVAMDVDIMTGLMIRNPKGGDSELKTFKSFLASKGYAELSDLLPKDFTQNITAMTSEDDKIAARATMRDSVISVFEKLKVEAEGYVEMQALVERAGKRLQVMLPRVYEITDNAFIKENGELRQAPVEGNKPNMYLAMGGTASGKGGLKKLAKKECADDLVVASLDDARSDCDRYWLYPATDNHNDDYKTVEEFAKAHRDLTTRRALAGNYNLFIDGSGVPYEGRNDKVSKQFKERGYSVSVLAAQAPLYINDPQKRRELSAQGKAPNDSARRLGDRLEEELRIVPLEIAAEKHIGFSIATRNAARDKNVDRFMIEDVSGPVGSGYTLSYVMTLGREDIQEIAGLQGGALKRAITERNLVPDWVKLPEGSDREEFFDAKVIRDNHDGSYRLEVITDIRQYVNMVQKGLLRRDAKGPEAWFDNTMRSDIEGHFKNDGGKLKIQSPQGVAETAWVNYRPLSDRLTPTSIPNESWVRS
jgi:hypothetical protein